MIKKILLILLLIFLSSFALAGGGGGEEESILEINYPDLGIEINEELATYVNYIFYLAIFVIGFIIFGSLVYGGVLYITSFGDTGRLKEGRKRITSSFLGGIILLSSWIVFNTIIPGFDIDLEDLAPLSGTLRPGIYACPKEAWAANNKISDRINWYTNKTVEIKGLSDNEISERRNAISSQRTHMEKVKELFNDFGCQKLDGSSGNARGSLFFYPQIFYSIPKVTEEGEVHHLYGLYWHEGLNFTESCGHFIQESKIEDEKARSITLYNRFPEDDVGEKEFIVEMFEKKNFEEEGDKAEFTEDNLVNNSILSTSLKNGDYDLKENLRSIKVSGDAIVVLKTEDNDDCGIITENEANLSGHHAIGTRACRRGIGNWRSNKPCPEKAYIIYGQKI